MNPPDLGWKVSSSPDIWGSWSTIHLPKCGFTPIHKKWLSPFVKERYPVFFGISAVLRVASSLSRARVHIAPALRVCVMSSQAQPKERKKLFSSWMTDGLRLLFFESRTQCPHYFQRAFIYFFNVESSCQYSRLKLHGSLYMRRSYSILGSFKQGATVAERKFQR